MQVRYVHYASAAVFSRDGKMLAIAPAGLPVHIIDIGARQRRCELGHPVGGTNALSFSRDGSRIGTADADCAVRIYDAAHGKLLAGNDDNWLMQPSTLDFTGDGSHIVVGSIDRVTVYVDTKTGKVVRRMDRDAEPPIFLQFSPNTNYLAILFFKADNMLAAAPIAVLDAESGRKRVEWMPAAVPLAVAWTADGNLLAGLSSKEALQIWRVPPPA